jgi:predicted metal-dependent hydrolase
MKIRTIQFHLLKGVEPLWLNGNGFKTQFFNALSMFFPFGEEWFIKSFRDIVRKDLVKDPALIKKIHIFTAQESMHRHAHNEFNAYLEQQGLPFSLFGWVKTRTFIFDQTHNHLSRLAVTMAYEHITAIFAYLALRDNHLDDVSNLNVKRMWLWHAAEEIEHRSIAFELYQHIGGGYWRRQYGMLIAIIGITIDSSLQTFLNLYRAGLLFRLKTWREAYHFIIGKDQFIRLTLRQLCLYIKPTWTPPDLGVDLAQKWLEDNSDCFRELNR